MCSVVYDHDCLCMRIRLCRHPVNAQQLSQWLPYAFQTTETGGGIVWSCNPWGNDYGKEYLRTSAPRRGLLLAYGACFGVCIGKDMDLEVLRTRHGGVCDDIERTCRVYSYYPPIHQFRQLIINKGSSTMKKSNRKPGCYLQGAGGQSDAFDNEHQHMAAKRQHLALIAEEFPDLLEIVSKPKKRDHWKLFEFKKVTCTMEPKQCMHCDRLRQTVQLQECYIVLYRCMLYRSC